MTPVHICALYGHVDILVILVTATNADIQDQWGFTALHYAVSNRKIQAVQFLLDFGANASLTSSAGSTPLQIAQELGYHEIADILASKVSITEDPAAPQFREWLRSLGAGAYISSFFKAGYDLAFVAAHGLSDEDCDCVGIPTSQMGLRRKLKTLHKIELFVPVGGKKEIDGEDGESSDEGDSADENSEGGDSDAS
ncbi:ANK3 [Symbiodinium microadriaticum]|nr:ANK3 [Symbiodinium microadriaticum]